MLKKYAKHHAIAETDAAILHCFRLSSVTHQQQADHFVARFYKDAKEHDKDTLIDVYIEIVDGSTRRCLSNY